MDVISEFVDGKQGISTSQRESCRVLYPRNHLNVHIKAHCSRSCSALIPQETRQLLRSEYLTSTLALLQSAEIVQPGTYSVSEAFGAMASLANASPPWTWSMQPPSKPQSTMDVPLPGTFLGLEQLLPPHVYFWISCFFEDLHPLRSWFDEYYS
jgi:hypothetical protein